MIMFHLGLWFIQGSLPEKAHGPRSHGFKALGHDFSLASELFHPYQQRSEINESSLKRP